MKKIAIGVDIGGSHLSCMGFDIDKKQLLPRTLADSDLDNHGRSEEIIRVWGGTIKKTIELIGSDSISGIGFAMPGPFDYVKGISLFTGQNGKYENTYGMNVPEMLHEFLGLSGDFKCRFINDATAFAIGEDQVGKAKDYNRSLSVTLGTGFGSAFIKDGLPVVEGDEVPENGCLWHLPFEGGIADDYFSTRGLLSRLEKLTGYKLPGVKEMAEQAFVDPKVQQVFDDFGNKMGIFLRPWIEKFGIEVFVMGGNISRAYPLFGKSLQTYLSTAGLKMQVAISDLKETAAFIGSATLVDDEFYLRILPALSRM